MSYPYMPMALARERQDTMLAEADAIRLARQTRAHLREHGTPGSRRSPLRAQGWLLAWSRLLTQRLAAGERSG